MPIDMLLLGLVLSRASPGRDRRDRGPFRAHCGLHQCGESVEGVGQLQRERKSLLQMDTFWIMEAIDVMV